MTTENEINNQELLDTLKDLMSRSMYAKTEMCKEEPMSDCPPIAIVSHGDKDDDWSPIDDSRNYYQYEACMSVGDYEGANDCFH